MGSETTEVPKPRHSPARAMLMWLVILGLAGLVLWLASERNSRLFYLVPEGNEVVVKKGMFLPVGRQTISPSDPSLGQVYAPLSPPSGVPLPEERTFDDRAALDQALYDLLAGWARADISSEKPDLLQRGLTFIARAERLAGVSTAQRDDLRGLRGESAYYEARGLIERGAEDLRQARDKLRMASEGSGRHAADAFVLLRRTEPLVEDALGLRQDAQGQRRDGATQPQATPAPEGSPSPAKTGP